MLEITEQPTITTFVEKTPQISELYRQAIRPREDLSQADYKDIQIRITGRINQLIEAYPNDEETTREFAELIYGPWLLSEETLKRGTNEQSQKELSARIQHLFVHAAFAGAGENVSENYRKNLFSQVLELEKSTNTELGRDFDLKSFVNGIKSELAIIKTLTDNGYRVIIPDYTKRSDNKSEFRSEALEWDVESGVDLIAVAPDGKIFLIDAKGRKYNSRGDSKKPTDDDLRDKVDFAFDYVTLSKLPSSLRRTIDNLYEESGREGMSIQEVEIKMPTGDSEMGNLGTQANSSSYQEALGRFGELKNEHQQTIIVTLGAA